MNTQLELFRQPMTVAQVVYREYLWQGRAMTALSYHPVAAMERTAKYFDIPFALVRRIVRVQGRWNTRRFMQKIKIDRKAKV